MTRLTKRERDEAWLFVFETAQDANASVRRQSQAQLLVLLLIADSLETIAEASS